MIILSYLIIELSKNAIISTICLMNLLISVIFSVSRDKKGIILFWWSLKNLIIIVMIWMGDIIKEGRRGQHTMKVKENLTIGFILFIVSEVILFMTLFFVYIYNLIIPSIFISSDWRSLDIQTYTYNGIPLWNVIILFMSGITVTIGQNNLNNNKKRENIILYILLTVILGAIFVMIQYIEYKSSKFTITDSIYGNVFFSLTSLLGGLMIIGILIIIFSLVRIINYDMSKINVLVGSVNLLFLDICFILIYILVYCYGY